LKKPVYDALQHRSIDGGSRLVSAQKAAEGRDKEKDKAAG
jgi:hypothetical protein